MTEIAKTAKYSVSVDSKKNRMYITVVGFWASPADVPNYIDDVKKAAAAITKGFTIVTDLTQMKTPAPEIGPIHEQAQKVLIGAGLKKTAEILTADAIAKMVMDRYSKASGMEKMIFHDKAEAEAWLDKA
ncbi:MAG: hypothetical protein EHM12_02460 [Dehalococcoidia bacterium]|nr:MAG: hypothetical protein EHM12_02460 [Dehalococcoidia bacterium]